MKISRRKFAFAMPFVLGILLGNAPAARAQNYSRVFVLGDSLSDDGNLYRSVFGLYPPSPPYYKGRFSNGPVWVENLVPKMGLTFNGATDYAYGGAETGSTNEQAGLRGMQQELSSLLSAYPIGDPAALYIVWGGANDYLDGQTNASVPVTNLTNIIKSLVATGARNFLVPNIPDLGKTPGHRTASDAPTLTQDTLSHNAALAAALQTLRTQLPTSNIVLYDIYTGFNQIIASPAAYGFTNVTEQAMSATSANPDIYLFWDTVHPTAAGHRIVANNAYTLLFPSVTGKVALESRAANDAPQTLTFQFRPTDGTANFTRTAAIGSTGAFTLTALPAKHYTVWIKGAKWLAKTVSLDATNGIPPALTATLPAGDANNDNVIDIGDFGVLVNAYGGQANLAGSGYDTRADFNDDGTVDIADFGLLVNNYGSSGDL